MNLQLFTIILALSVLPVLPATAQDAVDTTADTGEFGNASGPTRQGGGGVDHDTDPFWRSTELNNTEAPDTSTTRTRNYLFGTGKLRRATTGLVAPSSVSSAPIPSGRFSLGFGQGESKEYTGPFKGGPSGGDLPKVSTSSVDFDITSGRGGFSLKTAQDLQDFRDIANRSALESPGGLEFDEFQFQGGGQSVQDFKKEQEF